jgi:hypothetical protein
MVIRGDLQRVMASGLKAVVVVGLLAIVIANAVTPPMQRDVGEGPVGLFVAMLH